MHGELALRGQCHNPVPGLAAVVARRRPVARPAILVEAPVSSMKPRCDCGGIALCIAGCGVHAGGAPVPPGRGIGAFRPLMGSVRYLSLSLRA